MSKHILQLEEITEDNIATDDVLHVGDISANKDKKITVAELDKRYQTTPATDATPVDTNWKILDQEFLMVSSSGYHSGLAIHGATSTGSTILDKALVGGDENRVGIAKYTSSSTAAGYVSGYNALSSTRFGGSIHKYAVGLNHPIVPDATDDFKFWVGYSNDHNSIGSYMSCIGIDRTINATNYIAFTVKAGVRTNVDTGIPIDTSWHVFEISVNDTNTSHEFYIDGVSVATITTNLPNASMGVIMFQQNVAGAARSFEVDWLRVGFKPTTVRGTMTDWGS